MWVAECHCLKVRKKEDERSGRREMIDIVIKALVGRKGKLRSKECLGVNTTSKEARVSEQITTLLIPAACRNTEFYMIFANGEGAQ